jgi:hypothetical protein
MFVNIYKKLGELLRKEFLRHRATTGSILAPKRGLLVLHTLTMYVYTYIGNLYVPIDFLVL